MQIPTTPEEISAEKLVIEAEITQLEAQLKMARTKLGILRSVCQHPEKSVKRWHSNPMGRWPTNHFQCDVCGFHKED